MLPALIEGKPCPESANSVAERCAIEVGQLSKALSDVFDSATSLRTSRSIIYACARKQQMKLRLISCTGMSSAVEYRVPRGMLRHSLAGTNLSEAAEDIAGVLD